MARDNFTKRAMFNRLIDMPAGALGDNWHKAGYSVGSDAAEASSTTTVINATGHSAQVGDVIVMTSGTRDGEARDVSAVTTDTITVSTAFSGAPASTDTFEILRPEELTKSKIIMIENGYNQRVFFSDEGTTSKFTVPGSNATMTLELKHNNLHLGSDAPYQYTDDAKYLYVKADSTVPTSGTLYIMIVE